MWFSGTRQARRFCSSLGTESGTDHFKVCFSPESGMGHWKVENSMGVQVCRVLGTESDTDYWKGSGTESSTDLWKVSTLRSSSWSDCFAHRQVALGLLGPCTQVQGRGAVSIVRCVHCRVWINTRVKSSVRTTTTTTTTTTSSHWAHRSTFFFVLTSLVLVCGRTLLLNTLRATLSPSGADTWSHPRCWPEFSGCQSASSGCGHRHQCQDRIPRSILPSCGRSEFCQRARLLSWRRRRE